MIGRVLLGVAASWLLVALVWASQAVLGGSLQGEPVTMAAALRTSLVQTVPWIPVTVAVILLAARWPVTRAQWRRVLWPHLPAFALLVYVENVLVVLGFWLSSGSYGTVGALLSSGAMWAVLRVHVAALVYVAVAAATQAVLFYRATRARELQHARVESQLSQARLDALVAQIRPHFLFNTLHTIGHMWRSGRHTEADAMLDHLGDLFHRVQRSTSRTLIPLEEEMEMVGAYLAIEQARFQDRLQVELDVEPAAASCAVPPLLLQPLAENAVRHGVSESSSASRVSVRAALRGSALVLQVSDDGPGMRDGAATRGTGTGLAATRGTGTGLAATRARLQQLFGDAHTFDVRSSAAGTDVVITLPARSADVSEPVHA